MYMSFAYGTSFRRDWFRLLVVISFSLLSLRVSPTAVCLSVCLGRLDPVRSWRRFGLGAAEAGWVGGGERRWVMGDGLVHELRYGTEALGLQRDAVSFFPRVFFHSSGFVCHRTMCSGMIFLQR